MSWNYRIVKQKISKDTYLHQIKEVYYDKNGNINGYGDAPVPYGQDINELKQCLDLMYEALKKPIVEYKPINFSIIRYNKKNKINIHLIKFKQLFILKKISVPDEDFTNAFGLNNRQCDKLFSSNKFEL